jgi:hypothetical protein
MKKIAIPGIMAAAILFTTALVTMPPSNVQGGAVDPGDVDTVVLTLKCFYVDNDGNDRTDKTVDKSIRVMLIFYFTFNGDPITDTLTVLTCDRDDPEVSSGSVSAIFGCNGECNVADDFHKEIKIFRGGEENGDGEPWRLVWACHHEGEFEDEDELEDLLEDNKCRYKDNHATVQAATFAIPPPPP